MANENRVTFTATFKFVVASLLFSLAITGVAAAQNPVPLINQPLVPDTVVLGGAGFTLTVNGTGFVSGAVVDWNGSPLTTTFVSASRLTAGVPASNIGKAGTASVTVVNPGPGGGTSNIVFFPIALPVSLAFSGSAFPAGSGSMSVATGDFNRDGKLDLAVGDPGSGNVSILLGNGDGTFQAPVSYAVGRGSSSQVFQVTVGDLNGDGKLDLVVSDYDDNYVSVLLGNGDGTFQPAVNYGAGVNPTSVALADLNGDGKLDMVVSNQNCNNGGGPCGTGTVSILLGNGDGTFQAHVDFDAGEDPNWVTVGDFNGDGKLDLAVVNGQGNSFTSAVLILLGNGNGTFQTPVRYPLNTNGASGATADFNRDGKLDLAVVDNIGLVSIFLGNGDGTFQARVDYGTGSFPWGALGIADFNGDGNLDFAVANSGSNTVSIFLGNGDGTFQPQVQTTTGADPAGAFVGDLNGDGRLDLAVPNIKDNTVSILLQDGAVSLVPSTLNFGGQVIRTRSAAQKVVLTNAGTKTLNISSIAITGTNARDFSESNNCGPSLPPNALCAISVTFKPTMLGPRTAAVTITDDAPGSPQSVPLSGTGVTSGPNATLSPTGLTFGTQLVGTTSPAQPVTLSNWGTATLDISSIAASGDFSATSTCGSSLVALASCTTEVTFTPKSKGNQSGALGITDNAPGSPQIVSLKGVGTVVELNPNSLNFGVHPVGTSTSKSTKLTNTGSTALSITGIAITGTNPSDFSQTNTCGTSVAAGGSCSINVTFKPTQRGTRSADVSVSDDGGGSPQQVGLSGDGCTYYEHRCLGTDEGLNRATARSALLSSHTVPVPGPSGSSSVGTRVVRLVDPTRNDPYLANGSKRELLVRFWYPTALAEGCKPAAYTSPKVWSYFSKLMGMPGPEVESNSCQDAPLAEGVHPVVVLTPGYTGTFTDYTFILEDLASRGYVVASVDHTYEATVVEFPDGRLVPGLLGSHFDNSWHTDDKTLSLAMSVRSDDLKFVVDELERLNAVGDGPFAGKLDVSRIALMGHSLGVLAVLSGIQREPRFGAGVMLDGVLTSESVGGTDKAVLILAMGRTQWSGNECKLWSHLRGTRLAVNLKGAEHITPTDAVWLAKGAIRTSAMGPDKTMAAVRDYIAAFLDANLQGKTADRLLTGPSSEYPDAAVTTQEQLLCGQQ